MKPRQDITTPCALASKPSAAFSVTSTASATSAGSTRSGGSRLLFGEVDTSSERSSTGCPSVCSFVVCESSTFLRFWLNDDCRERFISYIPKSDLASLRLACHDFGVRAAPTLFQDLTVTFKPSTFSRLGRLAALDRVGHHVKTLDFRLPHSPETFLPPLVDPESGKELSFTYTPQLESCTAKNPKYGDLGTTEILTRQWPTLFHAATNVPAFVKAFSSLVNLQHLKISCPGYEQTQRYRRSTVDFALISLRIAVERNRLNVLRTLTLAPIHPGALTYLSPLIGYGASPRASVAWSRIRHLDIEADVLPSSPAGVDADQLKLIQTYLRNFQNNLVTLHFSWKGGKGPSPVRTPRKAPSQSIHPLHRSEAESSQQPPHPLIMKVPALHFVKLSKLGLENVEAPATDVSDFLELHKQTIGEVDFKEFELVDGDWDDALAPMAKRRRSVRASDCAADIPIMFSPGTRQAPSSATERIHTMRSPDTRQGPPSPTERVHSRPTRSSPTERVHSRQAPSSPTERIYSRQGPSSPSERIHARHPEEHDRRSARTSHYHAPRYKRGAPSTAQKVREGLLGCEDQLKKVLRGSVLQWLEV